MYATGICLIAGGGVGDLGAWQGGSVGADVRWLVTDQLGTPRMVIDHTGSLAGVSRHDYYPFGEEVSAGNTWRSSHGYGAADAARQRFTGQERDSETSLDYMQARYYSSGQGRFTGPDSLPGSATNPQTLNLYSYVHNDPLGFTDPTGHHEVDGRERDQIINKFEEKFKREQEFYDEGMMILTGLVAEGRPGFDDTDWRRQQEEESAGSDSDSSGHQISVSSTRLLC
jgi:RHS repeat-associated protein